MEIYKHAYKLIKKNIMHRKIVTLVMFIFLLTSSASAASDILLNGTSLYLSNGGSYGLYQGYVITVKSVSNDGSAWLELTSNDTFVKSEIVHIKGFFTYNKTNRTILSMRLDNIYSGSNDKVLVSFFPAYQYIDPDMPALKIIDITPEETQGQENNSTLPKQKDVPETVIAVIGIFFILFIFYIIRKLW
ncbi:MAG: hypothetical protein O8C61_09875 [Candidatus Methanoperedens sp.]|nr:hypothetical protein [Candidatus Methanoperedens sp.]